MCESVRQKLGHTREVSRYRSISSVKTKVSISVQQAVQLFTNTYRRNVQKIVSDLNFFLNFFLKFFLKFSKKLSKGSRGFQENSKTKENYSKYFPFRLVSFISSMVTNDDFWCYGIYQRSFGFFTFARNPRLFFTQNCPDMFSEIVLKLFPKLS